MRGFAFKATRINDDLCHYISVLSTTLISADFLQDAHYFSMPCRVTQARDSPRSLCEHIVLGLTSQLNPNPHKVSLSVAFTKPLSVFPYLQYYTTHGESSLFSGVNLKGARYQKYMPIFNVINLTWR